jgi:hypothetical protein
MNVEETAQRELTVALDEYTQVCLDKRRRFALWLMCYFDPYQPQAVNEARAAAAVEAGWDYR